LKQHQLPVKVGRGIHAWICLLFGFMKEAIIMQSLSLPLH
jgi:hypothetical protein